MLSKLPLLPLASGLLKHPQYLSFGARALWRKHHGIKTDYRDPSGKCRKPPFQVSIRITNRCNQRCAICGQFGAKGYIPAGGHSELLEELPVDEYRKMTDSLLPGKTVYYITGGEAFLYPGLFDVTQYMKSRDQYVYVITNGSLLERHVDKILEQRWDMLTSSFDGPREIHDKCRGVPGTFDKTVTGISAFLSERRKQRRSLPYFLLSATVSAANQNSLEEMFEIASELNPDCLILYLSWFTTETAGHRHASILKRELGVDAVTWKSYIGQNKEIDAPALMESLRNLSNRKFPFPWFHIPTIPLESISAYYNDPENPLGYGPCVSPWLMVDIMPNGDVVTCRDYVDVCVGNITKKSLPEIWNDTPFRKFRQLLQKQGGLLPQCGRCCGLMGF